MKPPQTRQTYTALQKSMLSAMVAARKQAGVSQAELAKAIGLNQSDISKIETGERRLDIVEFIQLSEYLRTKSQETDLLLDLISYLRRLHEN